MQTPTSNASTTFASVLGSTAGAPNQNDNNNALLTQSDGTNSGQETTNENQTTQPPRQQQNVPQESNESKQFKSMQEAINRLAIFAKSNKMDTTTIQALKVRSQHLTELWDRANAYFMTLIAEADGNSGITISYENLMGELEDTYFETSELFQTKMNELTPQPMATLSSEAGASQGDRPIKVIMPIQQGNIPNTWGMFDGNDGNWLAFRDLFKAAIHDNKDIDDSYKHAYLVKSLSGQAAFTIGRDLTSGTYQEAWERLMSVYNKPYRIARMQMQKFHRLPVLQAPASSNELKRMSDVTHETIRQLRALEYPVEYWDFVFVQGLHERLDEYTARQWELIRDDENQPTISDMTKFLDKEADAAKNTKTEKKQLAITIDNRPQSSGSSDSHRIQLPANRNTGTIPKPQLCEACPQGSGQYHPLFKCPEFLSLSIIARKDFASRRRFCLNCLRKGHSKEYCRDIQCKLTHCQADPRHNSLLCPYKQNTVASNAGAVGGPPA